MSTGHCPVQQRYVVTTLHGERFIELLGLKIKNTIKVIITMKSLSLLYCIRTYHDEWLAEMKQWACAHQPKIGQYSYCRIKTGFLS